VLGVKDCHPGEAKYQQPLAAIKVDRFLVGLTEDS